jgi:hypothetical protein
MKTLPLIAEWRSTSLAEDKLFLGAAAAVGLLLLYRRPKLSLVRWALLAGLLYLALAHARHQPILAIIATLLLARPLAGASAADPLAPDTLRVLAAFSIGFLLIAAARLAVPFERKDMATYPISAMRRISPELRTLPVLNSYSFGGPLILNGIKPYIDGRADLYGDAFMLGHHAIVGGDIAAFDQAARRYGIKWTILAPGEGLVPLLDRKLGWRRVYADRWAVVHVAEAR